MSLIQCSLVEDLQEERREIMQALLELDCIPAGMELFSAADEDQWTLIKEVINICDYYVVVIGGRYGSIGPDGRSYTEMEYRYALEQQKPVIAFLHKNPGKLSADRTEKTEKGKKGLENFRKFAQKKVVNYWEAPADLGSVVSRSIVKLMKSHPAVGWVRADQVPDEGAAQEILRLRREIEQMQAQVTQSRYMAPQNAEGLAQGSDSVELQYSFTVYGTGIDITNYSARVEMTWDEIFGAVSPTMINEANDREFRSAVTASIKSSVYDDNRKNPHFKDKRIRDYEVNDEIFQTIKVQFKALGLIDKSNKSRSVKDTNNYWTLTPYGDHIMNQLRAIRHNDIIADDDEV
ncbi:MAG: DUF4062 domain-containing protein [Proteobacteria bacterium]|nr:DUF4062 domain-containing protein [Pseudomonadota bacterium]